MPSVSETLGWACSGWAWEQCRPSARLRPGRERGPCSAAAPGQREGSGLRAPSRELFRVRDYVWNRTFVYLPIYLFIFTYFLFLFLLVQCHILTLFARYEDLERYPSNHGNSWYRIQTIRIYTLSYAFSLSSPSRLSPLHFDSNDTTGRASASGPRLQPLATIATIKTEDAEGVSNTHLTIHNGRNIWEYFWCYRLENTIIFVFYLTVFAFLFVIIYIIPNRFDYTPLNCPNVKCIFKRAAITSLPLQNKLPSLVSSRRVQRHQFRALSLCDCKWLRFFPFRFVSFEFVNVNYSYD